MEFTLVSRLHNLEDVPELTISKEVKKKQLFNQDIDVSRLYIMFFSEIFSFPTNFFSGWNQQIVTFTKLEF